MAPSLLPPPPSLPPGARGPGRPPQGPGEAAGPARPGSPQGKGCLCLKVTTRARCPGWAWCLPFPGRGGGDGGPPQMSGGDRGKAPLPPLPLPVTAPSGTSQLAGEGVNSLPRWGLGDQVNSFHCLGAVGRGRPNGLLPHPSLPSLPEAPFLRGTPGRDLGRGRRGPREGEMKARHLRPGEHEPLPHCPLLLRKAGSRVRRGGPRAGGGGVSPPLPPWNVRSRFSAAPLYPRQPAGGPGRHRAPGLGRGARGGGVPAGSGRR